MRRFLNRRTLLVVLAAFTLAVISAIFGLSAFINSPAFNEKVRLAIVREVTAKTGAKVTLTKVQWSLREQRLVLTDITIRGTEPESDPPLAHIEAITAGIRLRSLIDRRIDLFELKVLRPDFRLQVTSDGKTNLPVPPQVSEEPPEFSVSIDDLSIIDGRGTLNEHRHRIDLSLADVSADLKYQSASRILSSKVRYSGTLDADTHPPLAYTLSTDFDFTRGTLIAHRVEIVLDKASLNLQGRIDDVLSDTIGGKLEYSGRFEAPFLKRFFPSEDFGLAGTARGALDFSRNTFSTKGDFASGKVTIAGWSADAVRARYMYRYPDQAITSDSFTAKVLGGDVKGKGSIDLTTQPLRTTFDLSYKGIDSAQLAEIYPWDRRYVVYSKIDGELQGWVEGRMESFQVEGLSKLEAYTPPAIPGVVAFPISGSAGFLLHPGGAEIRQSDLRFFDTAIQADGRMQGNQASFNVVLTSSDLANLHFLYKGANGEGSFRGTLEGPVQTPNLQGDIVLQRHRFRDWTIQRASGSVRLNTQTESAELTNLEVTTGPSRATLSGTINLDGSQARLRANSIRLVASEFASLFKEKIEGVIEGDVTLTALRPLKMTGHLKASDLAARGQTLDTFEGDVEISEPLIEIRNATATGRGARLTGVAGHYDQATEAFSARADVASLPFDNLRDLGIPDILAGTLQRAHIEAEGTPQRPVIRGNATIEGLSFRKQTFPLTRLEFSTEWPRLNATLTGIPKVDLSAAVDLSQAALGYPFDAHLKFQNYSILDFVALNLAGGDTEGMVVDALTASGTVDLVGKLVGETSLSGSGTIREIHASAQGYSLDGGKPFGFAFDSKALTLKDPALLTGPLDTGISVEGSIGLTDSPTLDLTANGTFDLGVVSALFPSWSIAGTVAFDIRLGGSTMKPTIDGRARFTNAALGREGIYTTLSGLNGDIRFAGNRMTFESLEGRIGGGKTIISGSGLIQNKQLESLNVRIESDDVRVRYPVGRRYVEFVVDSGTLVLKGTSSEPALDGSLALKSLSYAGDFEPFLAMFRPGGLNSGGTSFDKTRLSVHLSGNRNISIQNELTDIPSARVDLDLKGTVGSPSLTGHIETREGSLMFQGKRYEITRGNIDFVDPTRIDPVIDVQAETYLRDYRVILNVMGRGNQIRVPLRSDPPLPELELIGLVAGGKTRDEIAAQTGAASLPTSEQVFQNGAASILVDLLRSRVGSRFGAFGLDRVRVDPNLVGANGTQSVRVTVSERVTKDLSITYSQDISSNEQRVIQVEYFLTKDLSLVASREENNETTALGLDMKLRKRF